MLFSVGRNVVSCRYKHTCRRQAHTHTHTNERASDVLYRNRHSKGKCKGASYLYNAKWSVWKRVSKRDGRWNISICCLFLPLAWSKPVATLRLTTRAQNSFRALHFQADVISKLLTQFISLCVCACVFVLCSRTRINCIHRFWWYLTRQLVFKWNTHTKNERSTNMFICDFLYFLSAHEMIGNSFVSRVATWKYVAEYALMKSTNH